MQAVLPFPEISPEIFSISIGSFDFALRWYALAYIAGIILGWRIVVALVKRPRLWAAQQSPMTPQEVEDLLTYVILGIILGGRLVYVFVYRPGYYLENPLEIPIIWRGGMAFHGGMLGVIIAAWLFAQRHRIPKLQLADALAVATPAGLFFGRLANFINAELWGRPTDVPWAMKFPQMCVDPLQQLCPVAGEWFYRGDELARHPSQLYQAGLEGLLLGLILMIAVWRGGLMRPGLITGLFLAGYGLARAFVELFRQADGHYLTPDNPLGHVIRFSDTWGLSMGQVLSLPMVLIGLWLILRARRAA